MMSHLALALALGVLVISIAPLFAQSGTAPTYISAMVPYQVRALTGTYAPTNGNGVTIRNVTAAKASEWLTNDPGGTGLDLLAVTKAWSGGFAAISGSKLYVHGGGHDDSANNGVYVFDYSGTDRPAGWTLPSISAVSAVEADTNNVYADGRPTSVHTYNGTIYAHHNNRLYRIGGSFYKGGNLAHYSIRYDIGSNTWTQLPNFPGGGTYALFNTIYDPSSGKILAGFAGYSYAAFLRTSNDTWSSIKNTNASFGSEGCGAFDPTRNRGILVGEGSNHVVTIDWNAETVTASTLNASGATAMLSQAGSCFYDSATDRYWLFGGEYRDDNNFKSPGWTTLYEMNAETFAITAHPLTGDTIPMQYQWGSYGRFVFMPAWRAIGTVASVDGAAVVIKLPGTLANDTTKPKAPANLRVI
jgi:hypothetical protein